MRKHEVNKKRDKQEKLEDKKKKVKTTRRKEPEEKVRHIGGKKKEAIPLNRGLMNIISPLGIQIRPNEMSIGENLAKVNGVIKYPNERSFGWLGNLSNLPGTVFSLEFEPVDNADFLETLNQNIKNNRNRSNESNDPLVIQRAKKAVEDAEKMMIQIDQNGEMIGNTTITVMAMANERERFDKLCKKVASAFLIEKCKLRSLPYLQKEGFRNLFPAYSYEKDINKMLRSVIPLSSVIGGFPFASSGFNDNRGYHLGSDSTGGLIILDLWKRGDDRSNSNMVLMGMSGSGKSTILKDIIMMEYALGTRIIIIDPEREYKYLTQRLNGDWINAGGDGKGRINPLQILPIQVDLYDEKLDENLDEGDLGAMALHLKTLDVFFSLYFKDMSDIQKALLKSTVIELYNQFKIFWETDIRSFAPEDFPTFKDLYLLMIEKEKQADADNNQRELNEFHDLSLLLKDLAIGGDSFLWTGPTTLKSDAQIVCLDTQNLNNATSTIKATQYFNLQNWAWQELTKDRQERVLLVYDEAYLVIDPFVPQPLIALRNQEKRARKYEGGILVASHSVVDFLDPSVKMYGQAVLDQPTYKIIMGTDGPNLEETKKLYDLTEAEVELLESKLRGKGLFMVGGNRLSVNFEIADYKLEYFGNAGGR
jgi:Domain of unknown function DUF87.